MACPGTFEKCKRQIERAIKSQKAKGARFAAMDLPYFTATDKQLTDAFIEELKVRGLVVEQQHTDSSYYGRVSW